MQTYLVMRAPLLLPSDFAVCCVPCFLLLSCAHSFLRSSSWLSRYPRLYCKNDLCVISLVCNARKQSIISLRGFVGGICHYQLILPCHGHLTLEVERHLHIWNLFCVLWKLSKETHVFTKTIGALMHIFLSSRRFVMCHYSWSLTSSSVLNQSKSTFQLLFWPPRGPRHVSEVHVMCPKSAWILRLSFSSFYPFYLARL